MSSVFGFPGGTNSINNPFGISSTPGSVIASKTRNTNASTASFTVTSATYFPGSDWTFSVPEDGCVFAAEADAYVLISGTIDVGVELDLDGVLVMSTYQRGTAAVANTVNLSFHKAMTAGVHTVNGIRLIHASGIMTAFNSRFNFHYSLSNPSSGGDTFDESIQVNY